MSIFLSKYRKKKLVIIALKTHVLPHELNLVCFLSERTRIFASPLWMEAGFQCEQRAASIEKPGEGEFKNKQIFFHPLLFFLMLILCFAFSFANCAHASFPATLKKDSENIQNTNINLIQISNFQPQHIKVLRRKINSFILQKNYQQALESLNELAKIQTLSISDNKLLAFLYAKTGNAQKSLEIIEKLLIKRQNDKDLLKFAFIYSMATKNWDKAIAYNTKLLTFEPNSEKLLKNEANLYAIKNDFPDAIKFYEKLIESYPEINYKLILVNLYMENRDFKHADALIKSLYTENSENSKVIDEYLNVLLAEQKTTQAYRVVKNNHLEKTKKGYIVAGNMAIKDGNYCVAEKNFLKALQLDPQDIILKNILGHIYHNLNQFNTSTRYYCDVLQKDPINLEAKLGLGYLEVDKKHYEKARNIFCGILAKYPENRSAKLGIVHSYLANGDNLKALEILKSMTQDAEVKLMEAKTYYEMTMYTDAIKYIPTKYECEACEAKNFSSKIAESRIPGNGFGKSPFYSTPELSENKLDIESEKFEIIPDDSGLNITPEMLETAISIPNETLKGPSESNLYAVPGLPEHTFVIAPETTKMLHATLYESAQNLNQKIRRIDAITFVPTYSFLNQVLGEEAKLDYQKFGMEISKNIKKNANIFGDYNVYVYTSGGRDGLTNVTHEFFGGIHARPVEKNEYQVLLGVKVFEFGNGDMVITDSWYKHYFNDGFNVKVGVRRNNVEQSFLSAVGENIDGVFTGRSADNKFYLEFEKKLPYGLYGFGRGAYGVIYTQSMPTNQYSEGLLGVGKVLYDNPKGKFFKLFSSDITTYNTSYQFNEANLNSSNGTLFSLYFSPSYYNATTANLKLEGRIDKWNLKYGIKGFWGVQTSESPDSTTLAWGLAPYLSYELNDNISVNVAYSYYNYATVQRNLFIVNVVIRGFRKQDRK